MTEVETDRREVFRYLGYGSRRPDEKTEKLAEACIQELSEAVNVRSAMREFPLRIWEDGRIDGVCFKTESKSLLRNLSGCSRVLVMAVTLGLEADRLLVRYGRLSVAKAVVMQAAAAAMTEACCNELCGRWREEYEERGLYLRPRFSPGYGDFSLSCQQGILDGLEASKRLGIKLTAGGLMVPSKSVTAVIGVSEEKGFCRVEGCEACEKKDCRYRRSEISDRTEETDGNC